MDEEKLQEQEAPQVQEVQQEVSLEEPSGMKVSWGEADASPVPTTHEVRTIRIYANESGRQLRVMKTADAADCLHIYVDVV